MLGMGVGRAPFPGSWHVPSGSGGRKRWLAPLTTTRGNGGGCTAMDQHSPDSPSPLDPMSPARSPAACPLVDCIFLFNPQA